MNSTGESLNQKIIVDYFSLLPNPIFFSLNIWISFKVFNFCREPKIAGVMKKIKKNFISYHHRLKELLLLSAF